jgi:biopolymer transport protein ExbB
VQLRTDSDQALRDIDTVGLDSTKLDAELKLRQDEAGYVTNLLDEYARNLETRLLVGEAERFAPVIAEAKDAVADRDASQEAKLDKLLAVVSGSIGRIDEVVGGTRFPGQAVGPEGTLAEGSFALIGPLAVFASKDRATVGVAVTQSGSLRPAVRPIEAGLGGSIVSIVETGRGLFPLDVTLGGALKEMVEKWSLIDVYKRGGPIMHPLLLVSILALAVVLERVFFIVSETRKRDPRALQAMFAAAEEGRLDEAASSGARSRDFIVRALAYAISHRERSLANALVVASSGVAKRFRRGIGILDTAITIAPLLGLLGTVTGMMHSFSLIGGDLSAPGAITGGIAEALIATAFGLVIAITCLVPYNYLNNRVESVRQEMEAACAQLELLLHPERGVVSALGTAHAVSESAA